MAISGALRHGPRRGDAEADLRQIGEAVGLRLNAKLHKPNHRQHHAQVPKPADDSVGIFSTGSDGRRRHRRHQHHGPGDLPRRQMDVATRIRDGQMRRIEEIPQVADIRQHRVADTPRPGNDCGRYQGVALRPIRDAAGNAGDGQQRYLFQDQPGEVFEIRRAKRPCAPTASSPTAATRTAP